MANTLQIKRGTGTSALAAGELGFNTDTKTLYIGSSAGNVAIGGQGAFLPLSGGNIIGNFTIKNKMVYNEANIVYSTTEPTSPVKGMIWLEP